LVRSSRRVPDQTAPNDVVLCCAGPLFETVAFELLLFFDDGRPVVLLLSSLTNGNGAGGVFSGGESSREAPAFFSSLLSEVFVVTAEYKGRFARVVRIRLDRELEHGVPSSEGATSKLSAGVTTEAAVTRQHAVTAAAAAAVTAVLEVRSHLLLLVV
jgi:hypothetical protein